MSRYGTSSDDREYDNYLKFMNMPSEEATEILRKQNNWAGDDDDIEQKLAQKLATMRAELIGKGGEEMEDKLDRAEDKMATDYKSTFSKFKDKIKSAVGMSENEIAMDEIKKELEETKAALKVKTSELNEVNLLNSKLLYVNRIFKANNLNGDQKLRVVETLDNASNTKEAKLIYETIKDTFTISKEKKRTPNRSIRENFGMASKSAGSTQSPARNKPVLNESNDMVARFKKLANITKIK